MEIRCAYKALLKTDTLRPHPSNPNEHDQAQIEMFAEILKYQGWRRPITVSKRSGFITKGHGALAAAKHAGFEAVPVDYQDYDDEAQELADIIADNQLARMSQMNIGKLRSIVSTLDLVPQFDLKLTGFELPQIERFRDVSLNVGTPDNSRVSGSLSIPVPEPDMDEPTNDDEIESEAEAAEKNSPYSRKIKSPVYEQKSTVPPKIGDMIDTSKTDQLIKQINECSHLTIEERILLRYAAHRHTVFNYEQIAEFYAHARKEVQILMENSALVIIDFNRAIENGFVMMTEELASIYGDEYPSE